MRLKRLYLHLKKKKKKLEVKDIKKKIKEDQKYSSTLFFSFEKSQLAITLRGKRYIYSVGFSRFLGFRCYPGVSRYGVNEQLSCKSAKSLNDQYKNAMCKNRKKCLACIFNTGLQVILPYP